MRVRIAFVAALALASCATTGDKTETATPLSVDPPVVINQYKCWHGIGGKGARAMRWEDSMCIRTKDQMVFGRYDTRTRGYVHSATVPFRDVQQVKLYKRGLAAQLQLETQAGVHVFGVKGLATDMHGAKTEAEYNALAAAGIPAGQTTAYVGKSNREMFVPFFLPSR